jgi:hypothetical protein
MAPSWVYSMILWVLWARFLSSANQCMLLPQNVWIWQNSSIVRSYSPYGYGNDLSEVQSSSSSLYSLMRLSVSSLFLCSRNVIHYCIEILPLRTCTYVIKYYYWWYCPLRCGSWATYVLSAFGLLVPPMCPSGRSLKVLVERLPWTLLVHVVYSCMLTVSPYPQMICHGETFS